MPVSRPFSLPISWAGSGPRTGEALVALLNGLWGGYAFGRYRYEWVDFETVSAPFSSRETVIADRDLTSVEKAAVKALRAVAPTYGVHTGRALHDSGDDFRVSERRVVVGESTSANAWTDGASFVAFDRRFLNRELSRGHDGFARMLAFCCTTLLHDEPDVGDHIHGFEFYERYERVMTSRHFGFVATVAGHSSPTRRRAQVGRAQKRAGGAGLARPDRGGGNVRRAGGQATVPSAESIGAALQAARNNAGLKVLEAAAAIGVSRYTIPRWESGHSIPDVRQLVMAANAYKTTSERVIAYASDTENGKIKW